MVEALTRFLAMLATLPAAPGVVAVGDIACEPGFRARENTCGHQATARLAQRLRPDAVLLLGDVQYPDGTLEEFHRSFDRSWGTPELERRLRPAPGNHEYHTRGAAGYFQYFRAKAGPRGRGYYAFSLGSWRIVSLNSNCREVSGGCGARSPQVRWLREQLRRAPRACTLAFMHHPPFSSGRHGSTPELRPMWKALVRGGVDVVLAGHDHSYERLGPLGTGGEPQEGGTTAFVVGTGGRSHYDFGEPLPGSRRRVTGTFGVLHMRLREGEYSYAFRSAEGHVAEALDRGTGRCR